MSIASTVNKNLYLGNGSTNVYNYTFKIFQESDIRVVILNTATSAETVLTSIDYNVTGEGSSAGGSVQLIGPRSYLDSGTGNLLTGFKILLKRNLDLVQSTDIRNQGDFFPEVHEDSFDRGVMVEQQLQEQLTRAAVLAETTSGTFSPNFPAGLEDNPNTTIIVNPGGTGFTIGPTASAIANANADAIAAAASAAAADASADAADASAIAAAASAVAAAGAAAGALVVSSQLTLSSAAPIQITGTDPRRKINIQSSAGEQDLGTLANQIQNGTTNGDELKLEGQSSTNYIILRRGVGNVLINGDWYGYDGSAITLIWNSTRSQWVEDSRNML
jgi:hypothetical protein